jgi:hypothetical protein
LATGGGTSSRLCRGLWRLARGEVVPVEEVEPVVWAVAISESKIQTEEVLDYSGGRPLPPGVLDKPSVNVMHSAKSSRLLISPINNYSNLHRGYWLLEKEVPGKLQGGLSPQPQQ